MNLVKRTAIRVLRERLRHQTSEVIEAKKNLGKPGYSAAYIRRMIDNCQQTKRMLKKYE